MLYVAVVLAVSAIGTKIKERELFGCGFLSWLMPTERREGWSLGSRETLTVSLLGRAIA